MGIKVRTASALCAMALVVAACGDDSSSSSSAVTTSPASAAASATTAGAATATTTAGTSGATASLDDLVAKAKQEGEVLAYASVPEGVIKPTYEAFTKKYGIAVKTIPRLVNSDLIARFESELASGGTPADAISVSTPLFYKKHVEDGVFLDIDQSRIPEAATYPKQFRGTGYVDVGLAPVGACYSTKTVKPAELTKYEDLLNPKFRVQWADPRVNDPALGIWLVIRDELGPDFLAKWKARKTTLAQSAVPASQLVVAGEGDVVFPCYQAISNGLAATGAPIAFTLLGPTTGGDNYWGVLKTAKHPNAASLLLNYLMSDEGQSVMAPKNYASPLGKTYPNSLTFPDKYAVIDASFAARLEKEKSSLLGQLGLDK